MKRWQVVLVAVIVLASVGVGAAAYGSHVRFSAQPDSEFTKREPFQLLSSPIKIPAGSVVAKSVLYRVPSNRRFVIQQVSIIAGSVHPATLAATISTKLAGQSSAQTGVEPYYTFRLESAGRTGAFASYQNVANAQVTLYADPGTSVSFTLTRATLGLSEAVVTLSGYLVPLG